MSKHEIKIITKKEKHSYLLRYGLPNAIDVGYGCFGRKVGLLFVDDFDNGKPIAYLPYKEK